MKRQIKLGLIGAMMLGITATGCVEEDQSVVMMGSYLGEGEIEEEDDSDEIIVRCEFPNEMVDTPVRTTGFVDLNHLGSVGQPLVSGTPVGASRDRYDFIAVFENRLLDSRSVGASSAGGGGGGFEGIALDKNDVFITSASVVFPEESNTFAGDDGNAVPLPTLERNRLVNMIAMSGGGISNLAVPLIQGADERRELETFLSTRLDRTTEPVTFVVEVQLHGETLAGNSVSSNTVEYPLVICGNCGEETAALCTRE